MTSQDRALALLVLERRRGAARQSVRITARDGAGWRRSISTANRIPHNSALGDVVHKLMRPDTCTPQARTLQAAVILPACLYTDE